MRKTWKLQAWTVLTAGLLLAGAGVEPVQAQISVVVAASADFSVTESEVADMFVGARTTWANGTKVQVVDQPDSEVGQMFYSQFLKQSAAQIRTQWTRLVLSGQALTPKKVADSDAVKRAVSEISGAIGYIPTSELDDSVREIMRIG